MALRRSLPPLAATFFAASSSAVKANAGEAASSNTTAATRRMRGLRFPDGNIMMGERPGRHPRATNRCCRTVGSILVRHVEVPRRRQLGANRGELCRAQLAVELGELALQLLPAGHESGELPLGVCRGAQLCSRGCAISARDRGIQVGDVLLYVGEQRGRRGASLLTLRFSRALRRGLRRRGSRLLVPGLETGHEAARVGL